MDKSRGITALLVMTQGKTRKKALEMIKDDVIELLKDSYEGLLLDFGHLLRKRTREMESYCLC